MNFQTNSKQKGFASKKIDQRKEYGLIYTRISVDLKAEVGMQGKGLDVHSNQLDRQAKINTHLNVQSQLSFNFEMEQLPHFDLLEILGDPEFPSVYPHPCFVEDIRNFLIISTDSMERNRTDNVQTSIKEDCLSKEQNTDIFFDIGGFMYPFDPNTDINIGDRCEVPALQTSQYLQMSAGDIPAKECKVLSYSDQGIHADQGINDSLTPPSQYSAPFTSCPSNFSTHLRHIDPRISSSDNSYFWPNPRNDRGPGRQKTRGCRLWEFLRNLLRDSRFNPSYICWENEAERKFRIVKSKELATLWGSKKGNTKMTYEKLSRAMRYYYKRKVLAPVIGKRLVYSFGPRADLTP